jgi:hypothetical protein
MTTRLLLLLLPGVIVNYGISHAIYILAGTYIHARTERDFHRVLDMTASVVMRS